MADLKQFKRADIVERNTPKDTVFIIDNKVYDVTKFLNDHPGGHAVLLDVAGKDATADFDEIHHSFEAKEMMQNYLVGEVVAEERVEKEKRQISWDTSDDAVGGFEAGGGFLSSWKIPVVLGLLVTLAYTYLFG